MLVSTQLKTAVSETQRLTFIDLAPNTRGLLNPLECLEILGYLPIPAYLGEVEWNLEYAEAVRLGEVAGISFEEVVAKCETKQRMAKAKTQAWIDQVLELFGEQEGSKTIKS